MLSTVHLSSYSHPVKPNSVWQHLCNALSHLHWFVSLSLFLNFSICVDRFLVFTPLKYNLGKCVWACTYLCFVCMFKSVRDCIVFMDRCAEKLPAQQKGNFTNIFQSTVKATVWEKSSSSPAVRVVDFKWNTAEKQRGGTLIGHSLSFYICIEICVGRYTYMHTGTQAKTHDTYTHTDNECCHFSRAN